VNHWKIGGVQLQLREDGTFSIYQPDSNRVMPKELAGQVAYAILNAVNGDMVEVVEQPAAQSTVGGGVISTSEGPAGQEPVNLEKLAARFNLQIADGAVAYVGDLVEDMKNPEFAEAYGWAQEQIKTELEGLADTEKEADRNALETSAKLDVKDLLGQMTAEAHADGTDETVTDFGPARTEKPKPPVKRRPGRPRKTT
jgi:hypothetical protein